MLWPRRIGWLGRCGWSCASRPRSFLAASRASRKVHTNFCRVHCLQHSVIAGFRFYCTGRNATETTSILERPESTRLSVCSNRSFLEAPFATNNVLAMNDESYLEEGHDNDNWTSPSKPLPSRNSKPVVRQPQGARDTQSKRSDGSKAATSHEQALKEELANVRKVNEAMEGVLESLNKAKSNMKTVNHTVNAASSLLNIWTRILSQTEHNQRLILDPSWEGASQDIQQMEDEATARQQAAERRDAEDQERRAAAARKAEEEERKRAETVAKPKTVTRGRSGLGRSGSTRATPSTTASTTTSNISRGVSSTRRTGSNIGRGSRGTRSRG